MKNDYYVYAHINPINDEVFYVGKGRGRRAYSKKNRSEWWKRYINKYGGFLVMFIKINITEYDAFNTEKKWINIFGRKVNNNGTLINLTDGGEGCSGLIHSEKTKKILSKYFKDIPLTEKHKLKISKSLMGKKRKKYVCEKISKSKIGVKFSEEHKIKLSESAKKRQTISHTTGKKIKINDKIYPSISVASQTLKISWNAIKRRLNNPSNLDYTYIG